MVLRQRLPERGRVLLLLLGQPLLFIYLNLQESNGGHQSANDLQDLVELTRSCYWRFLPRFVGQEILAVLFFLFFLGTGF